MSETPRDNDNSSEFDLFGKPALYGPIIDDNDATIYTLEINSTPVGVVWTDNSESAGVLSISDDPAIDDVRDHFSVAKMMNISPTAAYELSKTIPGISVVGEYEGVMADVKTIISKMKPVPSTEPITAAGDEESAPANSLLYATLNDDESEVLELVRSDDTGMYIRDNHSWLQINPDQENDRVWDVTIIEVTPGAIDSYDTAQDNGDPVPVSAISLYDIDKENAA